MSVAEDRDRMWKRLGAVRAMIEYWPDISPETKAWMIAERDKLIETLEKPQ